MNTRTAAPTSRTDVASKTARRVADAAVSVVAREGFDLLSVRSVAREAGVSGGAVQHHFATRADLLLAAFAQTVESISARLAATELDGKVHEVLHRLCEQALPLDEERRREAIVWVTLSAAAASHPDLAAAHRRGLVAFTDLVADIIDSSHRGGEVPESVDPRAAAAVLVAVVDGLTLQGIVEESTDLDAVLRAALTAVLR
ncbi:TetR/AcrR family transcriptional regulator [Nocardioides phosphati]|uniref:TetR/AcrR family transcriptional regulator n=1 Tax=Nocardioides phosphati TaxID=1867775 RepID=UPI0016631342|nr:TetR family transcriptional regulator C-terminal domain-containing protein [Nocardioides phosphati]